MHQTNEKGNQPLQCLKNPQIMKFSAKSCNGTPGPLKENDLCVSPQFMLQRLESGFNVDSAPKPKEVAEKRPIRPSQSPERK